MKLLPCPMVQCRQLRISMLCSFEKCMPARLAMQAHLVEAQHPQSEHFDVLSSETRSGESSGDPTSGPTVMDGDPLVVYNRNRRELTWIEVFALNSYLVW